MYAILVEKRSPVCILLPGFWRVVHLTIKFNTEPLLWTIEVKDIGAKPVLLSKSVTVKLLPAESLP